MGKKPSGGGGGALLSLNMIGKGRPKQSQPSERYRASE